MIYSNPHTLMFLLTAISVSRAFISSLGCYTLGAQRLRVISFLGISIVFAHAGEYSPMPSAMNSPKADNNNRHVVGSNAGCRVTEKRATLFDDEIA